MPELPEVETITREMREAHLQGAAITKAQVFWPRSIAEPSDADFCKRIAGQTIKQICRRGKFLVFALSTDTLLVHLRMTGKFLISANSADVMPHERVRLWLDDGRLLRYEDQRKFGKWYLLSDPEEKLTELGLEPLSKEFTLAAFQEVLKRSKMPVKPFLLNQRFVSGLGNIYVDEALWEAKIHPLRHVHTLSKAEIKALHQAIPKVLSKGIKNMGTSLGAQRANYFSVSGRRGGNQYELNVFRRDGMPCPRCHRPLVKIVVSQRGTHLCPYCQV